MAVVNNTEISTIKNATDAKNKNNLLKKLPALSCVQSRI